MPSLAPEAKYTEMNETHLIVALTLSLEGDVTIQCEAQESTRAKGAQRRRVWLTQEFQGKLPTG